MHRLRAGVRSLAHGVRTRETATTLLDAGSAGVIVYGAGLIYTPAAFILAGLAGLAISARFTPTKGNP